MTVYEVLRGKTRTSSIRMRLLRGAWVGQFEWIRELPGLFRGLLQLAGPFRKYLFWSFLLNGAIAGVETVAYYGTSVAQEALEKKLPYEAVVHAILWPALIILAAELLFPAIRSVISIFFIEVDFVPYVGELCFARMENEGRDARDEFENKRAVILQEGRVASYTLIESLTREPAFAMRGLFILATMFFEAPHLAVLIIGGLALEFVVTSIMDVKMRPLYKLQNDAEFALKGSEYRGLDGDPSLGRAGVDYAERTEAYKKATKWARLVEYFFGLLRTIVQRLVPLGCMIMLVPSVLYGNWDIGAFMFAVSYWLRSGDPVYVFFNVQKQLMGTREQIKRLGSLTGIDFGL